MRRYVIALALSLAACSSGEIGSSCTFDTDDCVEGAVCVPNESAPEPTVDPNEDSATCRAICEIEADCMDGFDCRRVSGSMSSACVPSGEEPVTDGGV